MFSFSTLLNKASADEPVGLAAPRESEHDAMYREEERIAAMSQSKPRRARKKKKRALRRDDSALETIEQLPSQKMRVDTETVKGLIGNSGKSSEAIEQRYAKLANSRDARMLPASLETRAVPQVETALSLTNVERQAEQHIIGGMLMETEGTMSELGQIAAESVHEHNVRQAMAAEGTSFNPRMPVVPPPPVITPSGDPLPVKATRRRKKPKKPTEPEARVLWAHEEEIEVAQGRKVETGADAAERTAIVHASRAPKVGSIVMTDTVNPEDLPMSSLAQYRARNGTEGWMLETLKAADKAEADICRRLPPPTENAKFMAAYGEMIPFYPALVRYHVRASIPVPMPETITREYAEVLLREPILSRGERPCVLAASGACESMTHYGFACRERLHQSEFERFAVARLKDPELAKEALPNIQRFCLVCALSNVQLTYFTRFNKKQHKDPTTEAPDGTSETYDDTEPICDFQMDVTGPGQFNLMKCVGIGDSEHMGLLGPVIEFHPDNFIPETIELATASQHDQKAMARDAARKEAVRQQSVRRGELSSSWGDPHAWMRKAPKGFEEPVAIFRTPARTPVPGCAVSDTAFSSSATHAVPPRPLAGTAASSGALPGKIRVLRISDDLLFRDGVLPVRIEGQSSSQSILTSFK